MNLLLVSNTIIVKKIFQLVCTKLSILYNTQNSLMITSKYDIIIVDEDFSNEDIRHLKKYYFKIALISNQNVNPINLYDFLINRPFLPTELVIILEDNLKDIIKKKDQNIHLDNIKNTIQEIDNKIDDNSLILDDSIILKNSLDIKGGILDKKELSKIDDILNTTYSIKNRREVISKNEDEDLDILSSIIDKAIDDVKHYEFKTQKNNSLKILLDEDNIQKLKPLVSRLDDTLFENLINGKSINIELMMKN